MLELITYYVWVCVDKVLASGDFELHGFHVKLHLAAVTWYSFLLRNTLIATIAKLYGLSIKPCLYSLRVDEINSVYWLSQLIYLC